MRALSNLISLNAPDLVLFVGEALVGNDAVDQLVKFNRSLADLAPGAATGAARARARERARAVRGVRAGRSPAAEASATCHRMPSCGLS
jgi:hypothetical protein